MDELVFSVSDFVAVFNQTISYAYPVVSIEGELDNLRISKGRWVYFNLKDNNSTIKFFGTVDQLPGPLEDGLMLRVRGLPYLHPNYGFSVNVQFMQPVGEGALKRASQLLEAKLKAEGLFDEARKRRIPYPPITVGLITSDGSAAYHDFAKILKQRWGGVEIKLFDVQVQGEIAPKQITGAIDYFNTMTEPVEVIVITRGGGSLDDLAAFNTETVTRAVALSRIPTLVAIGHEVDISLAELAADRRASTPSNAAEMLTPDRTQTLTELASLRSQLNQFLDSKIQTNRTWLDERTVQLNETWQRYYRDMTDNLSQKQDLLEVLNPANVLKRGYAIVRQSGKIISSGAGLKSNDEISLEVSDAQIITVVKHVNLQ